MMAAYRRQHVRVQAETHMSRAHKGQVAACGFWPFTDNVVKSHCTGIQKRGACCCFCQYSSHLPLQHDDLQRYAALHRLPSLQRHGSLCLQGISQTELNSIDSAFLTGMPQGNPLMTQDLRALEESGLAMDFYDEELDFDDAIDEAEIYGASIKKLGRPSSHTFSMPATGTGRLPSCLHSTR